jgi:2-methylcitrate dehydratase PrpD
MGPKEVIPPGIFKQDILDLMQKISIKENKNYNQYYPERRFACAEIITSDGRCLNSGNTEASWDPITILPNDEELKQKFLDITSFVLGHEKSQNLLELIWHLEEENRLDQIIKLSLA